MVTESIVSAARLTRSCYMLGSRGMWPMECPEESHLFVGIDSQTQLKHTTDVT